MEDCDDLQPVSQSDFQIEQTRRIKGHLLLLLVVVVVVTLLVRLLLGVQQRDPKASAGEVGQLSTSVPSFQKVIKEEVST